jgi:uncharacterized membrane protein
MKTSKMLAAYGLVALVFLALDAAWLSTMADRLYRPTIGHLMAPQFAIAPALVFYALYFAGVVYFAIAPGIAERSALTAAARGAALGLLAYATYDLTNQATLRDWPWLLTLADLAWGTFATGAASGIVAAVLLRRRTPYQ